MTSFRTIPGLQVGHAQNLEAATGCTVVLTPQGVTCGFDQRGGAPGTRETNLLRPMHSVDSIQGLVLTGGSAFGLNVADGVMHWLEERGHGINMLDIVTVPIVPAAVLFDLAIGRPDIRPDAAMGYAACEAASQQPAEDETGTVGAGTGATVGKILGHRAATKGGLGTAVIELQPDLWVGAMIAVNCAGDVIDPATGQILAGARKLPDGGFADTMQVLRQMSGGLSGPGNTVIGVVATNATLSKEAANKVAQMAHNGLGRTIRPAHTMLDGDTLFALATNQRKRVDVNVIGAFAVEAVAQAIINAVQQATSLAGIPALRDL